MKLTYIAPKTEITLFNVGEDILTVSSFPSAGSLEDMLQSEIDIVDRVTW